MFILPYKPGSESAKKLAECLDAKLLKSEYHKLVTFSSYVINWGNSKRLVASVEKVLNHPKFVRKAVNKLEAFKVFKAKNVAVPDFTTSFEEAKQWIEDGEWVVARDLLESHSGQGITLAKTVAELPTNSKLYVKYFKKTYEFRVHVFNGESIDYIQKRKRNDIDETMFNKYIRSYGNGWVFCREDIHHSEAVETMAVKAVKALGLDFGAVDVVMKQNGEIKILEVNCAPALEGTTLDKYTEAFLSLE